MTSLYLNYEVLCFGHKYFKFMLMELCGIKDYIEMDDTFKDIKEKKNCGQLKV